MLVLLWDRISLTLIHLTNWFWFPSDSPVFNTHLVVGAPELQMCAICSHWVCGFQLRSSGLWRRYFVINPFSPLHYCGPLTLCFEMLLVDFGTRECKINLSLQLKPSETQRLMYSKTLSKYINLSHQWVSSRSVKICSSFHFHILQDKVRTGP